MEWGGGRPNYKPVYMSDVEFIELSRIMRNTQGGKYPDPRPLLEPTMLGRTSEEWLEVEDALRSFRDAWVKLREEKRRYQTLLEATPDYMVEAYGRAKEALDRNA